MKHVLFDFDETLDRSDVQAYAKELNLRNDITLWVCTARIEPSRTPNPDWNKDLFKIADEVGISKRRIIFCNEISKVDMLKYNENINFIWILDDDLETCQEFEQSNLNIKAINSMYDPEWKQKCNELL